MIYDVKSEYEQDGWFQEELEMSGFSEDEIAEVWDGWDP